MNIFKLAFLAFLLGTTNYSFSQSKEESSNEPKKTKKETKFTEVVFADSIPASELLKRAVNWIKLENNGYQKINGVTTTTKAECIVTTDIKPKELNPGCDYTGTISAKVIIECKDSKYRYTIHQIKHTSKTGKTTGGSVDNVVPECGSMIMHDVLWKKIKGEGNKLAAKVIEDIKDFMIKETVTAVDEW